jgi:hypothetical protein
MDKAFLLWKNSFFVEDVIMKRIEVKFVLVCAFALLLGAGPVALGDWDLGDPHKMHYPQLPDLNDTGMDVLGGPLSVDPNDPINTVHEKFLADDFLCTRAGPITDIHIWASHNGDIRYSQTPWFSLVIYKNKPADANVPYSRPGAAVWNAYLQPTAERIYATADELFYDPNPDLIIGWDTQVWQYNFKIDPASAFVQEEGEIYWLGLHHSLDLDGDGFINFMDIMLLIDEWPYGPFGWKTSGEEQYEDDAVWTDVLTWASDPHVVPEGEIWNELRYPLNHQYEGQSIDLAFVINGPVEDPKNKRLKWSQPPIEWDPMTDPPKYCGWDELSWRDWVDPIWFACWDCPTQCHGDADCDGDVDADDQAILTAAWPPNPYNPCADFNHDGVIDFQDMDILMNNMGTNPDPNCAGRPGTWQMAADDYRCLGAMPVESVHWWGSHLGWEEPGGIPPDLPIAWRIGFWSNVPAAQRCDFLYGATKFGDLYKIDPFTGVPSLIGPIGFPGVTGLSIAPDGTLYGSCRDPASLNPLLITIDKMTGAGTAVGLIDPAGVQWAVPDISFRANGVLYGYGKNPSQLITIDTTTGQGTVIGATGYFGNGNGMDFAPNGTLYATPSDNQSLVIINPATGVGSDVAGTANNVPIRINALEFCESSGVLYGSWNDSWGSGFWYLVTLDLTTGLPTVIGPTVVRLIRSAPRITCCGRLKCLRTGWMSRRSVMMSTPTPTIPTMIFATSTTLIWSRTSTSGSTTTETTLWMIYTGSVSRPFMILIWRVSNIRGAGRRVHGAGWMMR